MTYSMLDQDGPATGSEPHLELRAVTKRLGRFELGPVDADLGRGVTALLGANGAGKTTLMRLTVGILGPDAGEVAVAGQVTRGGTRGVGYLPQDFSAPRGVRVEDYLRFIAWCRSTRQQRLGRGDVLDVLDRVGLASRAGDKLGALSGGMLRRVGVAQALLGAQGVVVLDEPTVGLDPVQRRDLRELLQQLGEHAAVLLSTHLSEDVAAVADRVLVLHEGAPVFNGSVDQLVARGGGSDRSGDDVERAFLAVIGGGGR